MTILLLAAVVFIAVAADRKIGARRRRSAALASKMASALATAEVAVADALDAFAAEPSERRLGSVSRAAARLSAVKQIAEVVAPK